MLFLRIEPSTMLRLSAFASVVLLTLSACDPASPATKENLPIVQTTESSWMSPGVFRMALKQDGTHASRLDGQGTAGVSDIYLLESAGLWFAGDQGGEVRATVQREPSSNTGPCGGNLKSVFHVFSDTLYAPDGWPSEVGAPTRDGRPMAYGDEMLWTSVCDQPGNSSPILSLHRPVENVRINIATFVHENEETVVFVRYEIRNEGAVPVEDAYAGVYSQLELQDRRDNLIGYASEHQLAYVYMDPFDELPDVLAARGPIALGNVAGVVVLETPDALPLAAHRNITRGRDALGESSLNSVEDYLFALKGLDYDGDAVLNPETGLSSRFAYPGNPVTGEGWIDGYDLNFDLLNDGLPDGEDVRSLLSAGPFTLSSGEVKVLTVAYLVQFESGLATGLDRLRQDAARLQAQPALWRFPVES